MADFEIDQNIDPMDQLLQALMMLPGVGASMGPAEAAQEEVAGAEEIAEAEEEIAEAEEIAEQKRRAAEEIAEAEEEIAEQKRRAEEISEGEAAVKNLLLKRKLNGFYEARQQRRLNDTRFTGPQKQCEAQV